MGYNDGGREKQPNLKDIPDEVVEEFIHANPEGASAEAIAQTVGLTRERVSVIIRKALEKLRRVAISRGLEVDDLSLPQGHWARMG